MSKFVLAAAAALALAAPALTTPALAASALAAPGDDNAGPQTRTVSARGLNLSDPAQAERFYIRLQHAVRQACQAGGNRPVSGTEDLTCIRQNMEQAVHSTGAPQLAALFERTFGPGAANSTAFAIDAR